MLWDLIRDFFVIHIFGGMTSGGEWFGGFLGNFYNVDGDVTYCSVTDFYLPLNGATDVSDFAIQSYINLGDWLSSIATIISITIILILCCLFIKKIVSLVGGLIR